MVRDDPGGGPPRMGPSHPPRDAASSDSCSVGLWRPDQPQSPGVHRPSAISPNGALWPVMLTCGLGPSAPATLYRETVIGAAAACSLPASGSAAIVAAASATPPGPYGPGQVRSSQVLPRAADAIAGSGCLYDCPDGAAVQLQDWRLAGCPRPRHTPPVTLVAGPPSTWGFLYVCSVSSRDCRRSGLWRSRLGWKHRHLSCFVCAPQPMRSDSRIRSNGMPAFSLTARTSASWPSNRRACGCSASA